MLNIALKPEAVRLRPAASLKVIVLAPNSPSSFAIAAKSNVADAALFEAARVNSVRTDDKNFFDIGAFQPVYFRVQAPSNCLSLTKVAII